MDSNGTTGHDNQVSISNTKGVEITGSDGYLFIGENGGSFRVSVSGSSSSGTGYTGTINGARFVNGICVGQA